MLQCFHVFDVLLVWVVRTQVENMTRVTFDVWTGVRLGGRQGGRMVGVGRARAGRTEAG